MTSMQRMEWTRLISAKRLGRENASRQQTEHRTEFQRDYDRLIFSSPFRRLQNKTQVFPLPGSVFVHNRLTHSLEVSSVGRSLGNDAARFLAERFPELTETLSTLGPIVSCACLAHDLGNPPFGHSGERAISTFFTEGRGKDVKARIIEECGPELAEHLWSDIEHFDGNAAAFRLLTHQYEGRRPGGYVMTYSVLASIVKYPYTSLLCGGKSKFGFFESETPLYQTIADELGLLCQQREGRKLRYARYPLAYFVEAADDICYEIMDIEDAHKLHILTYDETAELFLAFFDDETRARLMSTYPTVVDPGERIAYLRSCVIGCLEQECVRAFLNGYDAIMEGRYEGSLIDNATPRVRDAFRACAKLAVARIYKSREVLDVEIAGYRIIYTLLELFVEAALQPDNAYSRLLLDRVPTQYQVRHPRVDGRIMGILDFISGMTDVYALDLYRKITGSSLPAV